MTNKQLYKNNLWYLVLLLVIFIAFYFRGFIASSDAASSWFSPFYNLKQLFFNWSTYDGLGSYAPNNFSSFFLRLFYSLIASFNNDPGFIQKFSWITFFSVGGGICVYITDKLLKNKFYSFISVIFLIFNPVAQLFFWQKQHWTYYLVIPYFLGIILYSKFCDNKKFIYPILISILWFIFGFVFNQPAYFTSFLIIISVFFLFYLFKETEKIKFLIQNFKFALVFLLINFVYLFPLLVGGNQLLEKARASYARGDPIPILKDLKDVNFFYSFLNIAKSHDIFYSSSNLFLLFWTLFFVIIFYYTYLSKKQNTDKRATEYFFIFSALIVIFIFLIKGISPPFSKISEKIYSFKLMYIFRDFKDKFSIGYSLTISFLFILLIKSSHKYIKFYLILLALFSYITFFNNQWLRKDLKYSHNLSYLNSINVDGKEEYRVLNLPLVDYSFFYTDVPYYKGDNPMKNIFHKDILYTTEVGNDQQTRHIKEKLEKNILQSNKFKNYLQARNIQYVLNNKNSYVGESQNPYAYDYKMLSQYNFLAKIQDHKYFELYKFNDYCPRIYSDNLFFRKLNSTKYRLYIKDLKFSQVLSFLESFHKEWKLYLKPRPTKSWCESVVYYENTKTTECIYIQRFFEGEELFYLWKEPIFNDTHKLLNEYANGWIIDPEYIKQNFSKEYYIENPDGSVNIELVMYFNSQSYFYLGLLISGITLFSCFSYLGWVFINKKRKKKLDSALTAVK